jgi:hypothetical protein
MNDWLHNLPVPWMALVIFGCDGAVCDRGVRLGAADRGARPAVYRANLDLAGTAVADHAECAGESLNVIAKS